MNDEEGLEDTLIDAEVLSQHFGDVADATDVLETCIVERTISVAKLKWFIRRWSININKENLKPYSKNQGILEMACVYGTLPIVKCLLEDIGASVDGVSLFYVTKQQAKLTRRTFRVIRLLLEHGAQLVERKDVSLFHGSEIAETLIYGNLGILRLLKRFEVSMGLRLDCFRRSVQYSKDEIMARRGLNTLSFLFFECGVPLEPEFAIFPTWLHIAVRQDRVDAVELLLHAGANINYGRMLEHDGRLEYPIECIRSENCFWCLVKYPHQQIDFSKIDEKIVSIAIYMNWMQPLKYLLEDQRFNSSIWTWESTPLMMAAASKSCKSEIIQYLLSFNQETNVSAENKDNETALMIAVRLGNERFVNTVLEYDSALLETLTPEFLSRTPLSSKIIKCLKTWEHNPRDDYATITDNDGKDVKRAKYFPSSELNATCCWGSDDHDDDGGDIDEEADDVASNMQGSTTDDFYDERFDDEQLYDNDVVFDIDE